MVVLHYAIHGTQYPVDTGEDIVLLATSPELQELVGRVKNAVKNITC